MVGGIAVGLAASVPLARPSRRRAGGDVASVIGLIAAISLLDALSGVGVLRSAANRLRFHPDACRALGEGTDLFFERRDFFASAVKGLAEGHLAAT